MDELDLVWVRARFSGLEPSLAFLENAGGSVPVDGVVERARRYLAEDMVQLGAPYPRSERATARVHAGFDAAARLMGATPAELVLGGSTTANLYVLSHALAPRVGPGDEVVVTTLDHESNRGAWIRMAQARGATVREWTIDPATHSLERPGLDAVLSERTRLVCFTHCANVVGSLHDVPALTARIREAGALSVVDGVAFAPHRRVDVRALGADVYVLSLYKVYGPHLGLMYVREALLGALANQNHDFLAGAGAYTLMPGYVSHELAASVPGVVEYLEALDAHHGGDGTLDGAFARIAAHEERLAERLLAYLRAHPRVRLLGSAQADRARRAPTITFTVRGARADAIAREAGSRGVAIRAGHFYAARAMPELGIEDADDGVVRASMVHYNTLEEIDRLIAVLDRVLAA
ncbi:MAG: aminotransferase class V-fold PLP-dependent enzyme [Sandaracinaceae bacterium]|nr:aminotransferase class V-fold PLP-dependent enzyme [Sandaracinaceae bacterium]